MEGERFLIGGEWRLSGRTRAVVNPYTGKSVGEVYQAGAADIDEAIDVARRTFAATRRLTSYERHKALTAIAGGVEAERENLARCITKETGKPIRFSRAEVERCILTFSVAAEEARRMEGNLLPLDLTADGGERFGLVRRFPLGPIGAITPFNFPLNLVAHKVAPAIAAGNSVVLKPSSNAPLTALELARIVTRAGLPEGTLNVVPCSGGEAEQLVVDERVKLISFTGSPAVGWSLKQRAGKKRVVLELGGNAGVIVDREADLDAAVPKIIVGAYGNAGQSCIAVQRVYVHRALFDVFLERFVGLTKNVEVGDPDDDKTVVGPMIDEGAARKVEAWIGEAVAGGASVICGGKRTGAVLAPTVLVNVRADMNVCAQEVFAPLVTVESFNEIEEAIAAVNRSAYGLQAGLFTNDLKHVHMAFRDLDVGGVMINETPTFRMDHMPYGGVKDSGFGREGVRYAMEEMTELKLLGIHP